MKFVLALSLILIVRTAYAQPTTDSAAIARILHTQAQSWNRGDVEGFMQTYWKSDSLMFIGKSGVNWGWQATRNNYKKGYPDTAAMGKLHFDLIRVQKLSPQYYFVVGKWHLTRTIGNVSGHFTLLVQRRKEGWVIVADHSS